MMQKFLKELKGKKKQDDRSGSAESAATEQVETTVREIFHEAVPLPHSARQHSAYKEPVPSSARAASKQTDQSHHAPNAPRERIDDLRTKPEANPQQHVSTPTPMERAHRTYIRQTAKAKAPTTVGIPKSPQVYHPASTAKTPPCQHMDDLKIRAEQKPSQGVFAPTPQARMRNTFVKMQKQRFQNPSIESIDPSEPAAPILPQSVVSDVPTITLERQPVTAGSVKLASPTSKPVQPIALPQIQPTEHLPSIREKPTPNAAPREKPRRGAAIRTRESISVDAATIPPKSPHQKNATKQARKTATQDAQRKMLQKSNRTAKTAEATAKKLGEAAAKATKELLSALVSLGGGTALFVLFCVIVVAGAFLASPLGILFADEQQTEDTVPVPTAIAEIQGEYHSELERLQSGNFSSVQIIGQAPDWREVVAVFASRTAGAADGMDVFTLDEERVALLREVFWGMCQIETQTETVLHEDGERSTALTITITAKTAAQMRLEYNFSKYQNDALDILLENLGGLNIPMGSLTISQENAITLLENLTDDLEPARKAVVETAVQLVGKVTYFWGGKSLTLGWDERWGTPMEVTAAGSGSTGTVRPFGLDCSGFVDWTFYNATNGAYYPGRGGGAATQHSYCTDISWSEAQPGDLVFYPDDSHVGIVGGKDTDGNWLIIHCSGGANGVVITGAAGFTAVARPDCSSE